MKATLRFLTIIIQVSVIYLIHVDDLKSAFIMLDIAILLLWISIALKK